MSLLPLLDRREVTNERIALPGRNVWSQGEVDCCLPCAWSTCLEALAIEVPMLSPLSHYYKARSYAGRNTDTDFRGMSWSDGLHTASELGIHVYSEHRFPVPEAAEIKPSDAARKPSPDAVVFKLGRDRWNWLLLRSLNGEPNPEWRRALLAEHPLLMVMQPDTSYWKMRAGGAEKWTADGGNTADSLHAVAVIGYLPNLSSYVVQDSRGANFGRGGQWLLEESVASQARHRWIDAVYEIGSNGINF